MSERHIVLLPPLHDPAATTNKPAVIWCPGHGATATQGITHPYVDAALAALANAGYPVMCIDAGYPTGAAGWGAPVTGAAIAEARTYAQGPNIGAKAGPVIPAGVSMGGLSALAYAAANPANVLGVAVAIPAVAVQRHYTAANPSYAVAEIEAAYGATGAALTTAITARDPDQRRGDFAGIPIRAWCADDDTAAVSAWQTEFLAAVPTAIRTSLGNVGHDPTSVDPAQVLAFVNSLAA